MVKPIHGASTLPAGRTHAEILKPVANEFNGIKIAWIFPEQLIIGND